MTAEMPAPIAYRDGSAAAAVRDWVTARPDWSILKTADVPGPRQVVAKTLSQMAARDARLERVAQGVYIRVNNPWGKGILVYDRGRATMGHCRPKLRLRGAHRGQRARMELANPRQIPDLRRW